MVLLPGCAGHVCVPDMRVPTLLAIRVRLRLPAKRIINWLSGLQIDQHF